MNSLNDFLSSYKTIDTPAQLFIKEKASKSEISIIIYNTKDLQSHESLAKDFIKKANEKGFGVIFGNKIELDKKIKFDENVIVKMKQASSLNNGKVKVSKTFTKIVVKSENISDLEDDKINLINKIFHEVISKKDSYEELSNSTTAREKGASKFLAQRDFDNTDKFSLENKKDKYVTLFKNSIFINLKVTTDEIHSKEAAREKKELLKDRLSDDVKKDKISVEIKTWENRNIKPLIVR